MSSSGKDMKTASKGIFRAQARAYGAIARGRGQRLEPEVSECQCPIPKPSREGEVRMTSDFLGREVQRWFLPSGQTNNRWMLKFTERACGELFVTPKDSKVHSRDGV